tara:strand:+ start:999 stop:1880 length:882 start_codon:yes stop_codon:yes gene_type:complete
MVNCVQNQTCLDDVNSATREAQESDAYKRAPWGNSNFEGTLSCSHETKECHQSDAEASIVGTVVPIFLVALVFFFNFSKSTPATGSSTYLLTVIAALFPAAFAIVSLIPGVWWETNKVDARQPNYPSTVTVYKGVFAQKIEDDSIKLYAEKDCCMHYYALKVFVVCTVAAAFVAFVSVANVIGQKNTRYWYPAWIGFILSFVASLSTIILWLVYHSNSTCVESNMWGNEYHSRDFTLDVGFYSMIVSSVFSALFVILGIVMICSPKSKGYKPYKALPKVQETALDSIIKNLIF